MEKSHLSVSGLVLVRLQAVASQVFLVFSRLSVTVWIRDHVSAVTVIVPTLTCLEDPNAIFRVPLHLVFAAFQLHSNRTPACSTIFSSRRGLSSLLSS